jgi:hypothetical protein
LELMEVRNKLCIFGWPFVWVVSVIVWIILQNVFDLELIKSLLSRSDFRYIGSLPSEINSFEHVCSCIW